MNLYYFSKDWIDRMEGLFKNPRNTYEVKLWENGKLVYDSHKENKTTKPNNNAPKSIKGDYDLSIHGNKIVLVDNKDGTTVETRCHPDDEFDIGVGINEAFKKLNQKREEEKKCNKEENEKIKVGDWVEVVNSGRGYSLWYDWLPYNKFNLIKKFGYGRILTEGMKGQVKFMNGTKDNLGKEIVYFEDCMGLCHTIGIDGLKKVAKPNV